MKLNQNNPFSTKLFRNSLMNFFKIHVKTTVVYNMRLLKVIPESRSIQEEWVM